MFDLFDPQYAVQVPKHDYDPCSNYKMGGISQTRYPRKNWSAAVIYNCDHQSNHALTTKVVEAAEPRFLHRFEWLKDKEIGDIPLEFNFLVGEQEMPDTMPFNIHHTLGAPIFKEEQDCDYADYWKDEFKATFDREFSEEDIIN